MRATATNFTSANVQTEPFFADPATSLHRNALAAGAFAPLPKGRRYKQREAKVVSSMTKTAGSRTLGELRQWNSCDADHTDFIAVVLRGHIRR